MASLAQAIEQASASFSGRLVQPAAGYERWRRVHNGLIDKRPAAIARCHGVADPDNFFRQNVNILPRSDGMA